MKRMFGLALVLALVLPLASCSSDDATSPTAPFDFNGAWRLTYTVTEDPQGWWDDDTGYTVGETYTNQATITQTGTSVVMVGQGGFTYRGSCDPDARTFTATFTVGTVVLEYTGTGGEDGVSMSGLFTGREGSAKSMKATWTATLVSR